MAKLHEPIHHKIDRQYLLQKALTLYIRLKKIKQSELNLDERMFLENFEAAMLYLWVVKNPTNSGLIQE